MNIFKTIILFLIRGVIPLGIGLYLTIGVSGELLRFNQTPQDYSTLTAADLKPGTLVEGDITLNYGKLVRGTDPKDNSKTVGYYYLILDSRNCFLGLYTPSNDLNYMLTRQTEQSYDYFQNKTSSLPETVHFKGVVTEMKSGVSALFRSNIRDMFSYTSEEIDQSFSPVYIDTEPPTNNIGFLVMGIAAIAISLFNIALLIRKALFGR